MSKGKVLIIVGDATETVIADAFEQAFRLGARLAKFR